MSVRVGDLVRIRPDVTPELFTSGINGIVYDVVGMWVHIMWSDGKCTVRTRAAVEVVSESR